MKSLIDLEARLVNYLGEAINSDGSVSSTRALKGDALTTAEWPDWHR